jgi:DNA-binding MarR family transcriptional regulator
MSIETAIKQKVFKSPYHKLMVNLMYTAGWMDFRSQKAFRPYGITNQQYNILRILRGSDPKPCSVRTLTERMLDKSSNASRLVDKLLEKGLVDRRTCPGDRRQVEVTISEKGKALLIELDVVLDARETELKGISEKEALQVSNLLDRIRLAAGEEH